MKTIAFQSFSSLVVVYYIVLAIVAFNATPIFAAPTTTSTNALRQEVDKPTADKKGSATQQLSSEAVNSSKMTTASVSTDSTPTGSSAPSSTVANNTQLATNSSASATRNATYQSTAAPSPANGSATSMESAAPTTAPVAAASTTAAPGSSKDPKTGDGSTAAPQDAGAKQPIDLSSSASSPTVAAKDSKTPMVSSAPTSAATTSIAKSPSTEQKAEAPGGFKDDKDKDPAPKPDFDSTVNKDTGVKQPVNLNGEPIVNYRHKGSGSSETDSGSSHFMAYLLVAIFLFGFLYVLYHKKQKIMRTIVGFIVEGRRSGTVRRTSGSGGGGSGNYKLLPTDEFGSGNRDSDSSRTIVY